MVPSTFVNLNSGFAQSSLAQSSLGLGVLLAVGVIIAAAAGFGIGFRYARSAAQRSLDRARTTLAGLFAQIVTSMEEAQTACVLLESYAGLTAEQLERLGETRNLLVETVTRIVEQQQAADEPTDDAIIPDIFWLRTPQHQVTKLPDKGAFDENCMILARAAAESGISCGVLLIEIDRIDHLKTRFGIAGVQTFTRTIAGLICRSLRDADLVCQYSPEMFAILMPGVSESAASQLAEEVRQTVRHHNFRVSEKGPEVLVTAGFGLSVFVGDSSVDLAISRAENALKKSRKQGRNKLFFDSGHELLACTMQG